MTPARASALAVLAALVGVQWLWQRPALAAAVYSLPLLLVALGLASRRPNSWFWAGLLALPYFCHGIAEAWVSAGDRPTAAAEAALSFLLAVLVSWDGMRARFDSKAKAKAKEIAMAIASANASAGTAAGMAAGTTAGTAAGTAPGANARTSSDAGRSNNGTNV